ncbi:MAG: DUF1848 family protein [Calditrichaceae bacterium]
MKTIISASRRTDIPAFYLPWLLTVLRDGGLEVRNPFYPKDSRWIDLTPDKVAWFVFWSRNYQHFLKHRHEFDEYEAFFHFTILPNSKLEKNGIPIDKSLNQLEQLSAFYGPERIVWRYDPIVYWHEDGLSLSNHNPATFNDLCNRVSQTGVKTCYTSFANPYKKFIFRFKEKFPTDRILSTNMETQTSVIREMTNTAARYGIKLHSCSNDHLLKVKGIHKGRCIDGNLLNRLSGNKTVSTAKMPTRTDCGCTRSIDIGDYHAQPCRFGCIYCYANPVWR